MSMDVSLKVNTASGTLLSISPIIFSDDIFKTIVLAVIGATVSFCVSIFLKWIVKLRKKNQK